MKFKILTLLCLFLLLCSMTTVNQASKTLINPNKESIRNELNAITFAQNLKMLRTDLELPKIGKDGSLLSWKSDNTSYLSDKGSIVHFPAKGKGSLVVHLKVTAKNGKK